MNRRIRRARRRLRRGDARREPLLVLADDRYPGESFAALARCVYRYRSEFAPPAVAGALALTATVLHGRFPHIAPFVAVLTAALAVGLSRPEIAPDLRRIERGYAITVTITAGLWLTFATSHGPGAVPLPLLLFIGTIVGGLPWWAHRRRRAKVRVERTLDAWPDIADAVGLPGSRVMSAVVDLWGWRARIGLRRGQTVHDLVNRVPALESGLGTRPGAVRIEPDPARADHALIRVLHADPHAQSLPYPIDQHHQPAASITGPVPLGLFEDARPVALTLTHRHSLFGGVAGAGKSGVLNVILAHLVACSDVVLWGIDLKGGMELGPWASCLDRLATTPSEAADLLADAVAILDARAHHLTADGSRLWQPTPTTPALIIMIDEYAELAEQSHVAVIHADSLARRGRAVAVTLLAATQRPTQKAMGSGAVRSQMDIRICLRVRERRDVDLILGQGMLAAGWHAHTLDAPGKFLISTPEHHTPQRARAYLLTDDAVSAIAAQHHPNRPPLDPLSQTAADNHNAARPAPLIIPPQRTAADEQTAANPNVALWIALRRAPGRGLSVRELMAATGMGRTWVYDRLQEHATARRAVQVSRGRWLASDSDDDDRDDEMT
ncbi:MAG: FtsK/SpoIIIE domain-containing protein [Actinomycetota bacterium]|nr:FtsK/SpoIIIE domain-containing protein [Actinomycetota bacterium]